MPALITLDLGKNGLLICQGPAGFLVSTVMVLIQFYNS